MDADALLNAYVRRMITERIDSDRWSLECSGVYEDMPLSHHLERCPEIVVVSSDGQDGVYGCDTGCEYLHIEAQVSCPHMEGQHPALFEYDDFGSMDMVFYEMDRIRAKSEAGGAC